MSNIEKIKFGDQLFELVPSGVILGESGGTIIFQKGDCTFDEIENILKSNASIAQIGALDITKWSRKDLIYAGKLTKQSGYVIGSEQVAIGESEYMTVDVKADVMIAEFRKPDVGEEIKDTNALVAYISMMTGYDLGGATL